MPDVSMCDGIGCTLKSTCYRYTATPSEHLQTYFIRPPFKNDICDYYWEDKSSTKATKDSDNVDNITQKLP